MTSDDITKGTAAIGALAALSGFEIGRRIYRNSRLFCPAADPILSWNPGDHGIAHSQVEPIAFEVDGNTLDGWYCRARNPVASGLYCHGNSVNLTLDLPVIRRFVDAGISVMVFDYRGFGRSTGRPTIRGVVRDTVAAAAVHDELRPSGIPSILYGFSLGGAVAAQVARRAWFDALILQSTFTSLRDQVRELDSAAPLHLLCRGEFETAAVVSTLDIPVALIHGREDEVIPHLMARRLYRSAAHPWRLLEIPGAGHGNVFEAGGDRVVRFIRRLALQLRQDFAVDEMAEAS